MYVYGICSHVQYLFPQFLPPLRSKAGTAPSMQLESPPVTSPTGGPGAAASVTPHAGLLARSLALCEFWLFLHSSFSGRKRETWEGFFVRSHFPPSRAAARWNSLPSICHLAAASSWPSLLPARLLSGHSSAARLKYPLRLSALHPFILAARALRK